MRHENDVTSEFKCKFYKHLGSPNLATIAKLDEIVKIGGSTQLITVVANVKWRQNATYTAAPWTLQNPSAKPAHCHLAGSAPSGPRSWAASMLSARRVTTCPGGGYSVRKLMGVCRWPLKIGPKKIEGKNYPVNLGPKRSNSLRIGSFNTPKDRFGVGRWEKIPQKDRARSCQSEKRGSKPRHICITHHIGSTPPGTTWWRLDLISEAAKAPRMCDGRCW